jgi:ABC-type antimicrobial peptide transport system permease subunit
MNRILTPKVLLLSVVISVSLVCVTLIMILAKRPAAAPNLSIISGAITVVPAPTSTPPYVPPTPTSPPPTLTATFTPAPGQFALGVYVQITGTGVGLRFHSDPGKDAPMLFLGSDSEVFQITKGPKQADGDTWWFLTAPYDKARSGWAVQTFLSVLKSP